MTAAVLVIVFAAHSIAVDSARGQQEAVGADMAAIVCAIVYGSAVVAVYLYAAREKHRTVNRFDPRTWIRELDRVQHVARRAPSDAETEDALLDRRAVAAVRQRPLEHSDRKHRSITG